MQYLQDPDWLSHYGTVEETNPQRWRLAFKGEDETLEEAILSVQGIIWQKDLPPFAKERYPLFYTQKECTNQVSACEKLASDSSNSRYP